MGKFLVIAGLILVVIGLLVQFSDKIPFFGKLPGDISFQRGNVKIYIPIGTSIFISIILSLILYFIGRARNGQ